MRSHVHSLRIEDFHNREIFLPEISDCMCECTYSGSFPWLSTEALERLQQILKELVSQVKASFQSHSFFKYSLWTKILLIK